MPVIYKKWSNGYQEWRDEETGRYHREGDLPALIRPDGLQYWYKDGKLHRETGPAVLDEKTGFIQYWIDNVKILSEDLKDLYPTLYADWLVRRVMGE